MDDRISKDGKRAKCSTCGSWYGLDEAHGVYSSPECLAAQLAEALRTQINAIGIEKSDLYAAVEFLRGAQRGAEYAKARSIARADRQLRRDHDAIEDPRLRDEVRRADR